MANDIQSLELRIVELEDQLKELRAARQPANITADEIKAYQKVRAAIAADWGDECGINECSRCVVHICSCGGIGRCITRCINECTCGPCNLCSGGGGGLGGGRFGGLGG